MSQTPWYFDDRCEVVTVSGPDAAVYLQGQMSCDVLAIEPADSAMSLLLEPGGHLVAWGRLWRADDEEFRFELESGFGQSALDRLRRFLIRTAAEVQLSEAYRRRIRELSPGGAADQIGAFESWAEKFPSGVLVAAVDWPGGGIDTLSADPWDPPTRLRPGSEAEFELTRIAAGVPLLGAEVEAGMIPAAAGIVDRSVSFTKGCYVGQELVARVDSRGSNTPERLRRFVAAEVGSAPPIGSTIRMGEDEVGRITSVAATLDGRWIGLGYVHRGVQVPTTVQTQVGEADVEPLG